MIELSPETYYYIVKEYEEQGYKDFEHCQHYEEVEYIEGDEYKVGKLLDWTED